MTTLGQITVESPRRRFLIGSAALAFYPNFSEAQSNELGRFSRAMPFDIKRIPFITLEEFAGEHYLDESEEREVIEKLVKERPHLRGQRLVKTKASEFYAVKIEPDSNYAQSLVREAKKSIRHMFSFISSPYFGEPRIKMEFEFNSNRHIEPYEVVEHNAADSTRKLYFKTNGNQVQVTIETIVNDISF